MKNCIICIDRHFWEKWTMMVQGCSLCSRLVLCVDSDLTKYMDGGRLIL